MKFLLSLLIILAFPLHASDCKEVKSIKQGEVSSCSGIIFPEEQVRKMTEIEMSYELLLKQVELTDQKEALLNMQIEYSDKIAEKEATKATIWRDKAVTMTEKYMEVEGNRGFRDWVLLLTGVGITVLSGYALGAAR